MQGHTRAWVRTENVRLVFCFFLTFADRSIERGRGKAGREARHDGVYGTTDGRRVWRRRQDSDIVSIDADGRGRTRRTWTRTRTRAKGEGEVGRFIEGDENGVG